MRVIEFEDCFLEILQEFSVSSVSGLLYVKKDQIYPSQRPHPVQTRKELDAFLQADRPADCDPLLHVHFLLGASCLWMVDGWRAESDDRGPYLRVALRTAATADLGAADRRLRIKNQPKVAP